ncbi:MAG: hypothetical protein K8S00_05040 [Bacteroidales bacterium]|nr:hypothetical protein [Bacteroidales bacterium]
MMTTLEKIKHRLIDRILTTRNEIFLEAIEKIFLSTQKDDTLSLSSEQIEMLMLSEKDIEAGSLVSESDVDKIDSQWLD